MAHYIDAERLREAIDAQRQRMVYALYEVREGSKEEIRIKGMHDAFVDQLALIDSLQKEQPEVDLEKEVKKYWNAHALNYRIGRVADLDFMFLCARHFAEWQYQKDRAEFAKLRAKEWINGYDEGYAKGLNAKKEDK